MEDKKMNILELIDFFMEQGMNEEDANYMALYETNPQAYAEMVEERDGGISEYERSF